MWNRTEIFNALRRVKKKLEAAAARLFSTSRVLAPLHYEVTRDFAREQRSVLAGKAAYLDRLIRDSGSLYFLRRSVHRLEKGLCMSPRRSVFAEGYIEDTVEHYARMKREEALTAEQDDWMRGTLRMYFDAVDDTPIIRRAREVFEEVRAGPAGTGDGPRPAGSRPSRESVPSAEAFRRLLDRRRSVRWFEDRTVPEDLLREVVQMGLNSPSACNRQPYRVIVVQGEETESAASLAMGTSGFADNIPCLLAIVGDLSAYGSERDRHNIYVDGSLFAMTVMLSAEVNGLSTCPINWPDIEARERRAAEYFGLPVHERIIMFMAVGFPDVSRGVPKSTKADATEIMEWLE